MNLLEINLTLDAATVTAVFVGLVALISAYQTLITSQTKRVVEETHVIVNSQRTAMEALIKKLEGEKADLIAEAAAAPSVPTRVEVVSTAENPVIVDPVDKTR